MNNKIIKEIIKTMSENNICHKILFETLYIGIGIFILIPFLLFSSIIVFANIYFPLMGFFLTVISMRLLGSSYLKLKDVMDGKYENKE